MKNIRVRFFLVIAFIYLVVVPPALAGHWTVLDGKGQTIIPPNYDWIKFTKQQQFEMCDSRDKTIVHTDLDGKVMPDSKQISKSGSPYPKSSTDPSLPRGVSVLQREDGYVVVCSSTGCGVFLKNGRQVVPPVYSGIRYLGDKTFDVTQSNGGVNVRFLMDSKGEKTGELPNFAVTDFSSFHEGLLKISTFRDSVGYIDRFGTFAVNFGKYMFGNDFSCGLALVSYFEKDSEWSGFVDRTGEMVIGPFKDTSLTSFEKNLAVVTERTNKTQTKAGVIDKHGNFVIPMNYETILPSFDSKFLAIQNGHCYLLDKDERKLIRFPDGCDTVRMQSTFTPKTSLRCGFGGTTIDKYVFKRGSKWGYCDSSGRIIIAPKFAYCDDFVGEVAVAYVCATGDDILCGVINRAGDWVLPAEFSTVNIVSANRFIVRRPSTLDEAWKDGAKYSSPL